MPPGLPATAQGRVSSSNYPPPTNNNVVARNLEAHGTPDGATNPADRDAASNQQAVLAKVGDRVTALLQVFKDEHPGLSLKGELKLDFGTGPDGAYNVSMDNALATGPNVGIYKRHQGPPNGSSTRSQPVASESREPLSSTPQLGKHPRETQTPVGADTSAEKRPRIFSEPSRPESPPPTLPDDLLSDDAPAALQGMMQWQKRRIQDHSTAGTNKLEKIIVDWREQWREQGGWMYDFFKRAHDDEVAKKAWMEHMFKEVETRVGAMMQSYHITASSDFAVKHSQNLVEFQRLRDDIRWVEDKRAAADTQHDRREETWRSSSATFHDNAHKNRDAAEKWLIQELKTQRETAKRLTDMLLDVCKEVKGKDYELPPIQPSSPTDTRVLPLEAQLRDAAEKSKASATIDLTRTPKTRGNSDAQTSSGLSEACTASEGT